MKVIIENIHSSKKKESAKANSIGMFYSQDRYYTNLNKFMDSNLFSSSKVLYFIVSYLFQSNNFKHQSSIANGKTLGMKLVDVFCWLSMIAFIFLGGVAIILPIVKTFIKINLPAWVENFGTGGSIGTGIAAAFFGVITISYLVVIFKIKKKNKALSLKDYVLKKLEFILKYKFLLKASKLIGEGKNKNEFFISEKTDILGDPDRWLFLQVTNLMYMLFPNFSLALQFDNLEENYYKELKEIVEHDFKNINLKVVDKKYFNI